MEPEVMCMPPPMPLPPIPAAAPLPPAPAADAVGPDAARATQAAMAAHRHVIRQDALRKRYRHQVGAGVGDPSADALTGVAALSAGRGTAAVPVAARGRHGIAALSAL